MSWWWRTKPRSILRAIQWFSDFAKLEGENWEEKSSSVSAWQSKPIHPARRKYIYNAHSVDEEKIGQLSFNDYLSGKFDDNDTESTGRQDKHAFELFGFGFVDNNGCINVTEVGKRIVEKKFDDEDCLKQLLKIYFPNNVQSLKHCEQDDYVFPMQVFCLALERFGYLNLSEISLLFGCNNINKIENVYAGIENFRTKYNLLENKKDDVKVLELFKESFILAYGQLNIKPDSFYEYTDAFCRSLIYTGLFKSSGVGKAKKIRVYDFAKTKLNLINNNYSFEKKQFDSIESYMCWFGNPDSTVLPWDTEELRKLIISQKIELIEDLKNNNEFTQKYTGNIDDLINEVVHKAKAKLADASKMSDLKDIEHELVSFITSVNEKQYVDIYSKTKEARKEILEKYDEIILDAIEMGALWLEVNTWKSLLAIKGDKTVKRNFKVEEDLTPKSFAPGIGNTPDMEMYADDYIILPEVSLMTGVQQWEHEASSVIDHVFSFINNNSDKKVIGLFISSSLNIRTKWQFFILNRESWIGKPVPVVPLTIKQYREIIEVFYNHDLGINEFIGLVEKIKDCALHSDTFNDWFIATNNFISSWKINTVFAQ